MFDGIEIVSIEHEESKSSTRVETQLAEGTPQMWKDALARSGALRASTQSWCETVHEKEGEIMGKVPLKEGLEDLVSKAVTRRQSIQAQVDMLARTIADYETRIQGLMSVTGLLENDAMRKKLIPSAVQTDLAMGVLLLALDERFEVLEEIVKECADKVRDRKPLIDEDNNFIQEEMERRKSANDSYTIHDEEVSE